MTIRMLLVSFLIVLAGSLSNPANAVVTSGACPGYSATIMFGNRVYLAFTSALHCGAPMHPTASIYNISCFPSAASFTRTNLTGSGIPPSAMGTVGCTWACTVPGNGGASCTVSIDNSDGLPVELLEWSIDE